MSPSLPQSPSSVSASLAMARRCFQAGDRQQAERLCQWLLAATPDEGEVLHLLGLIAFGEGRAARAAGLFARAAAVCPDHAQAHANQAAALRRLGRSEDALAVCRRALALQPAEPVLLHNMAVLHRECGNGGRAITAFRRLVRLAPHNGAGLHGLLDALRSSGELTEAIAAGQALVGLQPSLPATHGNLGILLQFQGDLDAARRCYTRALTLDPGYAEARSNLGLLQLLTGDLAAGWANQAARWETGDRAASRRRFPLPAWDGGPLAGRRLLVWGELGVGDEILLAGMIPDLAERGIGCLLETEPRLVPLFARSFPGVEVVPRTDPPHPATGSADLAAHCALGDLGRWLRPDFASFPRRSRYLVAEPQRTAALRSRYRAEAGDKPLVGISWHSANPNHRDFKSAPLPLWRPVLEMPGIAFVDLQYGNRAVEREAVRRDWGVSILHDPTIDPMTDLDGFAAQVAALDLVISISNTTVHVAGALGVPTWTLLARRTGFLWCWFTERTDSPWYPSMRLYRQIGGDEWGSVFERIGLALCA